MSITSILSVARTGLTAQQAAIETISHNIANAETEGYSRQRVTLSANFPQSFPYGSVGTGVGVTNVERVRDALLDSLRSESRLIDELAATMRRPRAAVATDDLQGVDDSVFATHRILATLGQARLRRRAVNRLVVGVEELPVRMLEQVLGGQMTDAMRDARDGLQESAGVLSREVEINRRVLREALAAGDAHARVLNGTGASIDSPMAAAAARALLDRTA